jgi:hypothetical protein
MLPGGKMPRRGACRRSRRRWTTSPAAACPSATSRDLGLLQLWKDHFPAQALRRRAELRQAAPRAADGPRRDVHAGGRARQAKLLKDQAKREREFGALSCMFVCSETFDPGTPRRWGEPQGARARPNTVIETIGDVVHNSLSAYHFVGIDSTTATMSTTELGDPNATTYISHPMKRAAAWGVNLDWFAPDERRELPRAHLARPREAHRHQVLPGSSRPSTRRAASRSTTSRGDPALHEGRRPEAQAQRRPGRGRLRDRQGRRERKRVWQVPAGGRRGPGQVREEQGRRRRALGAPAPRQAHRRLRRPHEYEKFAGFYRVLPKSGTWWTLPDGTKTQQLRLTLEGDADVRQRIETTPSTRSAWKTLTTG